MLLLKQIRCTKPNIKLDACMCVCEVVNNLTVKITIHTFIQQSAKCNDTLQTDTICLCIFLFRPDKWDWKEERACERVRSWEKVCANEWEGTNKPTTLRIELRRTTLDRKLYGNILSTYLTASFCCWQWIEENNNKLNPNDDMHIKIVSPHFHQLCAIHVDWSRKECTCLHDELFTYEP